MTIRTRVFTPVLALLALSIAGPAWSDFEVNMPVGVTATSREVHNLHMLVLWICVVIGAGVYGAMIAAIVKFRKSKGAVAAKFTHNSTVEVSAYVDRSAHRLGLGRRLYTELFDRLKERGYRLLVAGITLPNEASVGIHEALGFEPVGVYRNIGFKNGEWWDVGWWQLDLFG